MSPIHLLRSSPPILLLLLLLLHLTVSLLNPSAAAVLAQQLTSGSDYAGLYSLRGSLGIRAAEWPRKSDPCTEWTGITCFSGRVVAVDISGFRRTRIGKLSPKFAVDGLRNLSRLAVFNSSGFALPGPIPGWLGSGLAVSVTALDLSRSRIHGPVPQSLGMLGNLTTLNLEGNSLDGSLADTLFAELHGLRTLKLSCNNFSGPLPSSLWNLTQLRVVDVSNNRFGGNLPSDGRPKFNASDVVVDISNNLCYGTLPSWVGRWKVFDVSRNYFQGDLLTTHESWNGSSAVALNCFRNATNQRTMEECGRFYADRGLTFEGSTPLNMDSGSNDSNRKRLIYILVGIFGGLFVVAVLVVSLVLCLRRGGRATTAQKEILPGDVAVGDSVQMAPDSGFSSSLSAVGDSFTYDQLVKATSNFSDVNLMKRGQSGDLFHGVLPNGAPVVVKRIDVRLFDREPYFVELDFFTRASHTRIIPLLGHCLESDTEKFLVYKYVPNKDLANALYRTSGSEKESLQSLDWITRLKIAIGLAEALCYLHHECAPPIIHSDVQASSILLDDKFEVRLGSLSSVCLQGGECRQNGITRFLRLPQSSEQGNSDLPSATCAYDVFCMGKVLLELVTGKLGISQSNDSETNAWLQQTISYISIHDKDLLVKIVDPSLVVDEDLTEEVWAMAIVAKSCLNPKPSKRPQVKYVLKALENPLKVVRQENISNSALLKATSSRGSWNVFGSSHSSSDTISTAKPPKEVVDLKHSDILRSEGNVDEQSFNHKRPSAEIFPEPLGFHGIEE